MEDADLLVNYAGQQGVRVEREVLDAISRARELLDQRKLTGTQEADFYSNYILLSQAVAPVTVSSLKSCFVEKEFLNWFLRCFEEEKMPKWLSKWLGRRSKETDAKKAIQFYRSLGFFVLIVLVVLQGYWFVGSYLMANVPILSEDKTEREEAIKQEAQWVTRESRDTGKDAQSVQRSHLDPDVVPTPSPASTVNSEFARNREQNATIEDAEVKNNIEDLTKTRLHTYEKLLIFWAPFLENIRSASHSKDVDSDWTPAVIARFFLNFLQTYVLPLLYGGLGAIAYVIRRLISEINSYTYRQATKSPYNTRILLGSLAGLAIGWFYPPSKGGGNNVLQTISPLSLAFLAGYSVELLFSAMDRLLDAFSSKASSASPQKDH